MERFFKDLKYSDILLFFLPCHSLRRLLMWSFEMYLFPFEHKLNQALDVRRQVLSQTTAQSSFGVNEVLAYRARLCESPRMASLPFECSQLLGIYSAQ